MAEFNPILNFTQGLQAGQGLRESQQANKVRDLQNALAGQAGRPGFNPQNNLDFQQLAALEPDRAAKMLANFQALGNDRKKAYFQDFKQAKNLLEAGNLEGVQKLFSDRRELVNQLGGDPYQVDYFDNLLQSGNLQGLRQGLELTERAGIDAGFLEAPKVEKKEAFQKAEKGLVFDPNTGSFFIDPTAREYFEQIAEEAKQKGSLDFKDRESLNKSITPIIKDAVGISKAANELDALKSRGSAASKLGGVFKFMKVLDPTSVVRETEQGQVYAAQGAASRLAGMVNSLLGKGELTPEGFADLVETAKEIANSNIKSTETEVVSLLDTFEDTIDPKLKEKVLARVPKPFGTDKKGGVVMVDANGNRARVFPDGTYEEL